jgi:hypothetical protein
MFRVDYLTASGTAAPYRLLERLEARLPHIFTAGVQKSGRHGYHVTLDCSKPGVTAFLRFKLAANPHTPTDYMLEVSGRAAEQARFVLRDHDPTHQVARLDVCRDVLAPGRFEHYAEVMQDLADRRRITWRRMIHDPRDPAAGGTLYIGSPDSEARDVLYDKHAQDPTFEPGTLRFEHRLRPKTKARKRRTADLPPPTAFRLGSIGADLAAILDERDHPPATLPVPVEKTAADSIGYMLASYRRKLVQLAQEIGGNEAVLQFIRERLPTAADPIADPPLCTLTPPPEAHAVACPRSGSGGSIPPDDMGRPEPDRTGTEQAELVQSSL